MTESRTPPAAEGNLSKTPFAHVVLYLYQHRSTGTLLVGAPGADVVDHSSSVQLLFQRGRGMAARFTQEVGTIEEGLLALCALEQAPFEFHELDLVTSGAGVLTGMFDPYALVAQASRTHLRADAMREVLARYGNSPLRMLAGADVDRLRLTPQESKLVDVLRAEPADIATLCAHSELSEDATRALIYVLAVTRIVAPYEARSSVAFSSQILTREPTAARAGSSSSPPRSPSTPAMPSGVPAWQALAARAGAAASLRPPSATGGSSTTIKITTAPAVRQSLAPTESLDPAGKLKRIEQLCQRSAFDEALPIIRGLLKDDPDNAAYQGQLGYLSLMSSTESNIPKAVFDAVNAALKLNDDEPTALYTKALAYKRMGKEREALHYFKRTVSVEPGHIDAARQVRLLGQKLAEEKKAKR